MKSIFCAGTAKTNDEYRKVIKIRMKAMTILMIIGIITATAGFTSEFYFDTSANDYIVGVYSGLGTSLFASGLVLWIKNRRLLNDEQKLKESRLSNTDERNQEISGKALRIAAYVMLISIYLVALIGGIFYPILFKVLMFIVCIFLLAYIIAFKYYNSKM